MYMVGKTLSFDDFVNLVVIDDENQYEQLKEILSKSFTDNEVLSLALDNLEDLRNKLGVERNFKGNLFEKGLE